MSVFSFFVYSSGSRPVILNFCSLRSPESLKNILWDSNSGELEWGLGISIFSQLPRCAFKWQPEFRNIDLDQQVLMAQPTHWKGILLLITEFTPTSDSQIGVGRGVV